MAATPPHTGSTIWASIWSVGVSLTFWACLLVASASFAAVALAPKLVKWQRLNEQFAVNQRYLVAVERQTLQLQQVVAALNEDPAFAEELARVEFDAFKPGEEVLPVDPTLQLDPRMTSSRVAPARTIAPSWQPLLMLLAGHQKLRSALLLSAAMLVILAFTWLHDAAEPVGAPLPPAKRSWWQQLRARYTAR